MILEDYVQNPSVSFLPQRLQQVPRALGECCAAKERQHHKTAPATPVPRKRKYDVPKILNPDFVAIESCRGRTAKMINRWRRDEPGLPSAVCRTTTEVRFLEVALEMIVEQKGGLLDDLPLEHQHCTFCRGHLSWRKLRCRRWGSAMQMALVRQDKLG